MTLITISANPTPYIFISGNAIKELAGTITTPDPEDTSDVCICTFVCNYVQKVFGEAGGEFWKNDSYTFPFKKLVDTDIIDIELFKNGVKLADIVDDTYGTLIDGVPFPTVPAQALYKIFTVEWEKVIAVEGSGLYQIKAAQTITGVDVPFESQLFKLEPYRDLQADGTVRIDIVQNGNVIRSDFDFTGMQLGFSTRIPGDLKKATPDTEQSMHEKQDYGKDQVQTRLINNWEVETKPIPFIINNALLYNYMLGNEIFITDYNILNETIFRRIPVVYEEVEKDRATNDINSSFLFKFTDRVDDILKRNF